ncbi:hypothetical protein [Altericroceibacterium endophyticum]|uniref:5-deoxy-glucuronate isomerase n=1 Tax=Altericroceibacterium endophyticum TaxID=1808508 RepID=A0A6I4T9R2_9SPHN|nr:hypothetical protein [Altericroceibacterium endophyticum]MXO67099.1 hypothetical protein [Altericroceibacterium endophyticum]
MYEADDPRAKLATAGQGDGPSSAFGNSTYARYYETPPQEQASDHKDWYTRGQNFVVCYSEVTAGARFERKGQVDEYVLLLHDRDMAATVEANGEVQEVTGYSLTIIPPGDSAITVKADGRIVRLISTQSPDVTAMAPNGDNYAGSHPQIPAFEPWPKPADGWKIRSYSLDVPDEEGRFGKIFRCTTFMVNVFPAQGPRDVTKLSPHQHDDFEQCSLALEGYYMHHMRWPWIANQHEWREDEHEKCLSPSVCVIPPKVIHTSAPTDPESNVLVDIFSPPREDFSDMPGWVLNAADYPRP